MKSACYYRRAHPMWPENKCLERNSRKYNHWVVVYYWWSKWRNLYWDVRSSYWAFSSKRWNSLLLLKMFYLFNQTEYSGAMFCLLYSGFIIIILTNGLVELWSIFWMGSISPDLTPLDFSLCGHLKSVVIKTQPATMKLLGE